MTLLNRLKSDLTNSLKTGQKERLQTLRFVVAAVRNGAIAKYGAKGEEAMTDADVLEVIKKQAKERRESIEAFEKGGRPELVEKEKKELAILEEYLPKQMSDEELKKLLEPIAKNGEANFGLLMQQAMAAAGGKADGGRVSATLRKMLQK